MLSNKPPEICWSRAEKPYPKKSATLVSLRNSYQQEEKKQEVKEEPKKLNPFRCLYENSDDEEQRIKEEKTITIKDLCPADKARIADLIKELAKVAGEKEKIEKSLEEERKHKELEITEILKQQEILLNDKQKLLKKFSKTQQKLKELQNDIQKEKEAKKITEQEQFKQAQTKQNDDVFGEKFKSSTPKNLSPRSLSPVLKQDEDFFKKQDLVKERLELAEEQKKIKLLLEQQEEILKKKQEEILEQQRLHVERLAELARLKSENEHQKLIAHTAPVVPVNQLIPIINQACLNTIQSLRPEQSNQNNYQSDSGIKMNDLNDESLDNLANIVYKKMLLKKKKLKQNSPKEKKPTKLESSCSNQEDDLIDFIIKETNKKESINGSEKKSVVPNETELNLEESKLIEDLFFIK